jgi:hypothetical protein
MLAIIMLTKNNESLVTGAKANLWQVRRESTAKGTVSVRECAMKAGTRDALLWASSLLTVLVRINCLLWLFARPYILAL